jgi:hypothetical protein
MRSSRLGKGSGEGSGSGSTADTNQRPERFQDMVRYIIAGEGTTTLLLRKASSVGTFWHDPSGNTRGGVPSFTAKMYGCMSLRRDTAGHCRPFDMFATQLLSYERR